MNILETPITVIDGVTSTNGHVVSLAEFLNDASSHQHIQQIRMTEDKAERTRLKSGLPCATISAICPDGRKADDAFEHTGLICIDIDGQDNYRSSKRQKTRPPHYINAVAGASY